MVFDMLEIRNDDILNVLNPAILVAVKLLLHAHFTVLRLNCHIDAKCAPILILKLLKSYPERRQKNTLYSVFILTAIVFCNN